MKYSKFNLLISDDHDSNIAFNTLTGNTLIIDDVTKNLMEEKNTSSLSKDNLAKLQQYGFLVDEFVDENRFFSYFNKKQKFNNQVVSCTVLLTWACNLKCTYCYEGAGLTRTTSLTQEKADSLIKFMKNQAEERNSKILAINLFGGEPLVKADTGFYILEELNQYCLKNNKQLVTSIITNGTLLTEEIINKLKKYNCQMIQITLDGVEEIHDERRMYKNGKGSFKSVLNGIKLSLHNQLTPVIRINVDKINLEKTEEILKQLSHEGLSACHLDFGIVRSSTNACSSYSGNCFVEEELGDTLEYLWNTAIHHGFKMNVIPMRKWTYCGLYNDSVYTLAPNGDLYKCWEHVGEEEHKIGILSENGIMEDTRYAFFDWMTHDPLETKQCSECSYLPACGGGCGVISYNNSKTYHEPGCFKTKGVLEKQIKFFLKSNEKQCSCNEINT